MRGETKRRSNHTISLGYKNNFPTLKQHLNNIGFDYDVKYFVSSDQEYLPTFRQKILGIVEDGEEEVYDIEVEEVHNFVANGAVVHNCSLYPSVIIAYNICYSTMVKDTDNVSDEHCNVIEWSRHEGCSHDDSGKKIKEENVVCGDYRFRFLKSPKGILPELLEYLLDARKKTKNEIKKLDKSDPMRDILDKRQLAFKVSCNSVYGTLGVSKGYLPFMPAAMCTTAMGRYNIKLAGKHIEEEYNAKLVYGD
jgi:DNA polymerase elongation subunit (family B)